MIEEINFFKKNFSEKDITDFIDLSINDNLRSEGMKDQKNVRWKFIENPLGPANYFFFKNKDKIVGRILSAHYPGKLVLNKKHVAYFCLSDLYIDKNNRQISNLKNLYFKCINETKGIIFHSSNENSEKFYTKILGLKIYFKLFSCGLPISTKPVKGYKFLLSIFYKVLIKCNNLFIIFIKNLLNAKKLKIKISENLIFDEEMENLLKENYDKGESFFYRDKSFFKWRYALYKKKFLIKVYKQNELIGYLTLIKSNVLNLKNLILLDFQFKKTLSFIDKIKIKLEIINIGKNQDCDTIYTFGNKKNKMFLNILGYPFFNLPDKILPHSNPMFVHNIGDLDSDDIEKVNFTISDFDYF